MRMMIAALGKGGPELDHYADMFGMEFEGRTERNAA
jgi:hypothetical protein